MNIVLKKITILTAFLAGVLFIYWIKCQSGIDVFSQIAWERYLPLRSLQKRMPIIPADVEEPMRESFEDGSLSRWSKLWSISKKGRAAVHPAGIDGSNCVVLADEAPSHWSFVSGSFIEVMSGEDLSYRFSMRTEGGVKAKSSIVLYDADKKMTERNFVPLQPVDASQWSEFKQDFIVPLGTKYIRFRIAGSGPGRVLLDDIHLRRGSRV